MFVKYMIGRRRDCFCILYPLVLNSTNYEATMTLKMKQSTSLAVSDEAFQRRRISECVSDSESDNLKVRMI